MIDQVPEPWPRWPQCPCGLEACEGLKLTRRGHVPKCLCTSCRNSRNVKKGKRGQAATHRNLGGTGFTPGNEESGLFYDVTVRPEVKAGGQVPKGFASFIATDWFRRALSQSERAIPSGVAARPAVSIDGKWLVVDIRPKGPKV